MTRHHGWRSVGQSSTTPRRKPPRTRRLLLEALEDRRLLAGGLHVTASSPTAPVNLRTAPLASITVTFDRTIDYAPGGGTFTAQDVAITGPDIAIVASSIAALGGNQYQVVFPSQTHRGTYTFTIGPNIADLSGNLMDQNQNGTPGETQDGFITTIDAIDADTIFITATTIGAGNTTYDGQDVCVRGTAITIDGTHAFKSLQLISAATVRHSTGSTVGLNLTVSDEVIVNTSSAVSVDGRGYGMDSGPGAGPSVWACGSGGGYGGSGGASVLKPGGSAYGSLTQPTDLGSGGGSNPDGGGHNGGAGGGAIRMVVGGTLTLDGQLTADGTNSTSTYSGGGGSGGSVYLTVGTLAGSGSITAEGGNGSSSSGGAGGGGGRIAVYYDATTFAGTMSAHGGSGTSRPGGAGTILTTSATAAEGNLVIDNGGNAGATTPVDSLDNRGTVRIANQASATLSGTSSNVGSVTVSAGATLKITGTFSVQGSLILDANGVLDVAGILNLGNPGILSCDTSAVMTISGSLLGDTRNADRYHPTAVVTFDGSGTSASPQLLEAMSKDLGNVAAGYTRNFAFGSLALSNNTYVKLVDQSDNGGGASAEALYVNALSVPAGSKLDLNGIHVYARTTQINGTVLGGFVNPLPDGGPLSLDRSVSGQISVAGETDEWTLFGRAGRAATVLLNPGTSGSPAALSPTLNFAQVRILDPNGNTLASANSTTSGTLLSLLAVPLPSDGVYRVRVSAAAGHATNTGNYVLTVGDASADEAALQLNQRVTGAIDRPLNADRWTFSATAGQQLQFDLVNTSTPGLLFDLTGPGGATVFQGLQTDSSLLTLSTSGNYEVAVHGTGGQTGSYSFQLKETTQTDLALGATYAGTFAGSGQAQIFRVSLPIAQSLIVALNDSSTANHNELYANFGSPPTRSDYDVRFSSPSAADQDLFVPNAIAGTWYILVYADVVPSPSSYTLRTIGAEVLLKQVTPDHAGNSAAATLTLTGAGFDATASVELMAADSTAFPASLIEVDSYTQITATFAAGAVPVGTFSVRVSRSGGLSDTLLNAFTVLAGGAPKLETNLIVPSALGRHQTATIYVEYANTGTVAMPAPLLILESADSDNSDRPFFTLDQSLVVQGFWTSAIPDGFSHSVQILGSGDTPGVLQPGESKRVPVYYAGLQQPWSFTDNAVELQVRTLTADDATPMDWNSLEDGLRPPWIGGGLWTPLYLNVKAQTGTTSGDYVRMLDDNASYLGRLGETVLDVQQLWAFELQQANGISPVGTLAAAVDAAVVTPGLSLSIGRTFSDTIISRCEIGPLGYGWAMSWQTRLEKDADGSVTIVGSNGSRRRFQPDSRSSQYFAEIGDNGVLTAGLGGSFTLRELDGLTTAFRADGKLDYVADTNGNRITAGYTGAKLTSLTHSSGPSLTIAYDPFATARISAITSSDGRTAHFTYDASYNHVLTVQGFDGQTTRYTYDTVAGNGLRTPCCRSSSPVARTNTSRTMFKDVWRAPPATAAPNWRISATTRRVRSPSPMRRAARASCTSTTVDCW